MAIELTEKRQYERVPLALPVIGKCPESLFRCHHFEGKTKDVSYNGLCIEVSGQDGFDRDQNIKFRTQLYEGDYELKANGVVRWVNTQIRSEEPITIGVKLTRMGNYRHWIERIEEKTDII